MIVRLPTGRQGRGLALGLLLAVLATAWLTVAAPLRSFYTDREEQVVQRRALLRKLDSLAAELPTLKARVATLRGSIDKNRVTLDGASDAIASALLQGHIEQDAALAGVTLGSTEILPTQAQGEYRRIGLRLMISGSYEALTKFLSELETAAPPLVVSEMQIRGTQWRVGIKAKSGLDASLEIYGFRGNESVASVRQ
jgi:Tfp pilus assembly protein PilO